VFVNGAAVVNQANDGERSLLLAVDSEQQPKGSIEDPKLTLLEEELTVGKEAVETGRLRVSKQTHTREASIDENLPEF
jgi:stress response protein YsnF